MSSMGMVHVRHFKFVFRSQGMEPNIEKIRVFYQLKSNMGFFSIALRTAKKILKIPPKSFHDWKMKFFFIRAVQSDGPDCQRRYGDSSWRDMV
ncbi:hypothetical protein Hanom_Chr12g01158741 [Helianthus anomalus]